MFFSIFWLGVRD